MTDFDAIVIGSGLGGSSAAAHLAAVGKRVLMLERYSVLGGSSHVFRRQGKWEFDCGVHYLGDCGPDGHIPTLMRGLGLDDRISWLPLDSDAFDTFRGPDLELKVPVGWDAFEANLVAAFPHDAKGLRQLVKVLRALSRDWNRDLTPASMASQNRWLLGVGAAAAFAYLPVVSLFLACRLSPRTILTLGIYCGLLGSTPSKTTSTWYAVLLNLYIGGGAYFPRGGGQALSAAFAEVTTTHGGVIRRNTAVEKILVDNGKVRGVRLSGGEIVTAPAVVSAGDAIRTFTDLVDDEHIPFLYRRRVGALRMGLPFINAYFGVELDLRSAPNGNIFVIPSWDDCKNLATIALTERRLFHGLRYGRGSGRDWAEQFAARGPTFVQSSTRRDPDHHTCAPMGHGTLEVQSIVPHNPAMWGVDGYDVAKHGYRQDATYNDIKEILIEGMAQRIEVAYPGASSAIKFVELGTPAAQERFVGNSSGAPFGLAPLASQTGALRPGTKTPIEGLYLAGTNTPWGPATEGSMLSGRHAASAVVGRDLGAEVRGGAVLADRSKLRPWPKNFDALRAVSNELDAQPDTADARDRA
ncbi:phytoene desaturase family protein [Rhodococcus tibetensis]|uniref:NAD(P)/FAD-dependent oxidoreductase n=1 Tax=Rhodococcus tibetensis TaxID=2965064 RepID=A0ABT1QKG8_9NOCA|nr:NAD(P)/FAD-dependent oxidoreductase [Rhodococcus sp. FXJ9.536]MCQ4122776.1 NAD(P)/FAD-dependent oxidoreductase [Rhodococcus sp. FXJ9.536]